MSLRFNPVIANVILVVNVTCWKWFTAGEDAFTLKDCNIETCKDNLCNDKTAEEVAAYDGVPARAASVALIFTTLAFLWAV